ncbi:MAG: DUF3019 domain-containing protein [Shewanella sp.]
MLNYVLTLLFRFLSIGIFTLSLVSGFAAASDKDEEQENMLKLSPEFCITSADDSVCELTIVLEWKSNFLRPVCFLSDYEEMEKWCAESAETHSLTLNISATDDIQFVMIDKETHQTLAGVKLKVTLTAEPKVRRRYRNPWSLF